MASRYGRADDYGTEAAGRRSYYDDGYGDYGDGYAYDDAAVADAAYYFQHGDVADEPAEAAGVDEAVYSEMEELKELLAFEGQKRAAEMLFHTAIMSQRSLLHRRFLQWRLAAAGDAASEERRRILAARQQQQQRSGEHLKEETRHAAAMEAIVADISELKAVVEEAQEEAAALRNDNASLRSKLTAAEAAAAAAEARVAALEKEARDAREAAEAARKEAEAARSEAAAASDAASAAAAAGGGAAGSSMDAGASASFAAAAAGAAGEGDDGAALSASVLSAGGGSFASSRGDAAVRAAGLHARTAATGDGAGGAADGEHAGSVAHFTTATAAYLARRVGDFRDPRVRRLIRKLGDLPAWHLPVGVEPSPAKPKPKAPLDAPSLLVDELPPVPCPALRDVRAVIHRYQEPLRRLYEEHATPKDTRGGSREGLSLEEWLLFARASGLAPPLLTRQVVEDAFLALARDELRIGVRGRFFFFTEFCRGLASCAECLYSSKSSRVMYPSAKERFYMLLYRLDEAGKRFRFIGKVVHAIHAKVEERVIKADQADARDMALSLTLSPDKAKPPRDRLKTKAERAEDQRRMEAAVRRDRRHLRDLFDLYSKHTGKLSSFRFVKLVRERHLIGPKLTAKRVDLVVARVMKSSRRMDFATFLEALKGLAGERFPSLSPEQGYAQLVSLVLDPFSPLRLADGLSVDGGSRRGSAVPSIGASSAHDAAELMLPSSQPSSRRSSVAEPAVPLGDSVAAADDHAASAAAPALSVASDDTDAAELAQWKRWLAEQTRLKSARGGMPPATMATSAAADGDGDFAAVTSADVMAAAAAASASAPAARSVSDAMSSVPPSTEELLAEISVLKEHLEDDWS